MNFFKQLILIFLCLSMRISAMKNGIEPIHPDFLGNMLEKFSHEGGPEIISKALSENREKLRAMNPGTQQIILDHHVPLMMRAFYKESSEDNYKKEVLRELSCLMSDDQKRNYRKNIPQRHNSPDQMLRANELDDILGGKKIRNLVALRMRVDAQKTQKRGSLSKAARREAEKLSKKLQAQEKESPLRQRRASMKKRRTSIVDSEGPVVLDDILVNETNEELRKKAEKITNGFLEQLNLEDYDEEQMSKIQPIVTKAKEDIKAVIHEVKRNIQCYYYSNFNKVHHNSDSINGNMSQFIKEALISMKNIVNKADVDIEIALDPNFKESKEWWDLTFNQVKSGCKKDS